MLDVLTSALADRDPEAVVRALAKLEGLMGDDWLEKLKESDVIPDPSKTHGDYRGFVTDILLLASSLLQLPNEHIETTDVGRFALVLLHLGEWFRAVEGRLSGCELFKLSPARQLQLLCAGFEDQSRLVHEKLQQEINRLYDTQDMVLPHHIRLLSTKTKTNTTGSLVGVFDAKGESLELCLRYLFWKHKGRFGQPETRIDPYCDPLLVGEVMALADIQGLLILVWTIYRFKGWRASVTKQGLVFDPPSRSQYMLEEVSIDRQQNYFTERVMNAQAVGMINPRRWANRIKKLCKRVSRLQSEWLRSIPESELRVVLEEFSAYDLLAAEALEKQYKDDAAGIHVGKGENRVLLRDALTALKYLRVLGYIMQGTTWRHFRDDKRMYESLCPVLDREELASKLAGTGLLDLTIAKRALGALAFDPKSRNLEIWQQPLIPWDDHRVLFLPSIAVYCDVFKFVESYLADGGYSFEDRGPAFESAVRNELRKHGRKHGVRVVPHPIKFEASDGKPLEIDLLAVFRDFVVVAEIKCVKTPTEISQTHKPWPRIQEGADQVKRALKLLSTDWNMVRQHAQMQLPEDPPDQEHVIGLVVTNIFTFTGQTIDGIPVCDDKALVRFFGHPDMAAIPVKNQQIIGETKVLHRLYMGTSPTPQEFVEYLRRPPLVEIGVKQNRFEYQPILPVDKHVTPMAFLRVVPRPLE